MASINLNEESNIKVRMSSETSINAQLQNINYIPGYQVAEEERRKNELERIENENEREEYYEEIQKKAQNGEFKGEPGEKGDKGDKGDSGVYIGDTEPTDADVWIDTAGGELDIEYTETDPTVPEHVKNITEEDIEKWNSNTGGSGSDFSGSYNDLTDKPITRYETTTIKYFNTLETGVYLITGIFRPYNGASRQATFSNTLVRVRKIDQYTHVWYEEVLTGTMAYWKVANDSSSFETSSIKLSDVKAKLKIEDITSTTFNRNVANNTYYQCTNEMTSIVVKFSTSIEAGFETCIAFKTGITLPTITVQHDNLTWYGEDVVSNVFTPQTNKLYRIRFFLDNFEMRAVVNEDNFTTKDYIDAEVGKIQDSIPTDYVTQEEMTGAIESAIPTDYVTETEMTEAIATAITGALGGSY